MEYSLLMVLEDKFDKKPELIDDINKLSDVLGEYIFSGWTSQPVARKKVGKAIRTFIRKYVREYGIDHEGLEETYQNLIKNVENYGRSG
jgi:hypothetical protein